MKNRKNYYLIILVVFILSLLLISCNEISNVEENNDGIKSRVLVAYIKEDGLYYSNLSGEKEVKIHDGSNFEYPLISKDGSYIAYTKEDKLYIYNIEEESYDQIDKEIDHYYRAYDWIDNENIVYGSIEKAGLNLYNSVSKEKTSYLDEDFYTGLVVSKDKLLYASKIKQWTTEDGNYWLNHGIVEVDINKFNGNENPVQTLIKSKETTEENIGTNPIVWNISNDGKYIYIMEKYASGSLSTDSIFLGIYEVESGTYKVLEDIETLSYKNHLSLNSHNYTIGLIQGSGREMIENKELVLVNLNKDKTYNITRFMDNNLIAMTPSFSIDGKKVLYSASVDVLANRLEKYEGVYDQWYDQAHNIYEFDIEKSIVRQLTDGNNYDFLPINISIDTSIFIRYNNEENIYYLLELKDDKESILIENLVFSGGKDNSEFGLYGHIDTEKAMDIFVGQ